MKLIEGDLKKNKEGPVNIDESGSRSFQRKLKSGHLEYLAYMERRGGCLLGGGLLFCYGEYRQRKCFGRRH